MTNKKKKEKKTCQYKWHVKCDRPLYDNEHCIFHSKDKEGKKDIFMEDFKDEYKSQKKKNSLDFTGFVFPEGANLKNAKLKGADLQEVELQGAKLQGGDLQGAYLYKADLQKAKLYHARLQRGKLNSANLQGADLQDASLQEAKLRWADLQEANLQGADLQGAYLRGADLRNSSFEKANVYKVKTDRHTKFRGIDVTQAKGSPRFVRFAKDQEFLEELQSTLPGKIIYHIWNVFADCGRSIWRWLLWCFVIAFIFGALYADYPVPNIKPQFLQDFLTWINPEFHIEPTSRIPTFFTPYYFSIVTFTTLGFGDVTPLNLAGEIWLALEVFLGYIMLGGLISIFANKLARRS